METVRNKIILNQSTLGNSWFIYSWKEDYDGFYGRIDIMERIFSNTFNACAYENVLRK